MVSHFTGFLKNTEISLFSMNIKRLHIPAKLLNPPQFSFYCVLFYCLLGGNFSIHLDSNLVRLLNLQAKLYRKCNPQGREMSNNDKKKNNTLNYLHLNSRGKRIEQKGFVLILTYFFITVWCSFMELYKSHEDNWGAHVNLLPCPFWVSSLMT